MSASIKTLILTFIVLFASSCKLSRLKPAESSNVDSYRVGDEMHAERFLTSSEKTIGTRLCNNIRAKRNRWEVSRTDLSFTYDIQARTACSGSLKTYSLNASVELSSGDLVLKPSTSSTSMVKEILTDLHPALADVCESLIAGEADVSNTTDITGTSYQVTFYEIGNANYVLITRFLQDSNSVWRAALVDESKFLPSSTGRYAGVVVRRAQEASCSNGGSTFVQQQIH